MSTVRSSVLFLTLALFLVLTTIRADPCDHLFRTEKEKELFNKQVVLQFYRDAVVDVANLEAGIRKHVVAKGYIQHNPNCADGVQALIDYEQGLFGGMSGSAVDFISHIIADGDFVVVHELDTIPNNRTQKFVTMNMYRLECGKLAEHWDIIQAVDPNAVYANSHPFF